MKTAKTLTQLAQEIERQQATKKDLVALTLSMRMTAGDEAQYAHESTGAPIGLVGLKLGDQHFGVNQIAHGQIAEYAGIPQAYYRRMLLDAPQLLANNVNNWLHRDPKPRMVRTLDGKARAFLSDRYRPLEHADLAEAVLPALLQLDVQVLSCEITERRLYIKAIDNRITKDVPSGKKMGDGSHVFFDTVSPAIVISNSEVGFGALLVETAVWTRACTNLAIAGQHSMRKYHVGAKHDMTDALYTVLSEKTRRLTDAATWAQVKDVVRGAFDRARFDALTNEIAGMAEQKITGDAVKVVELAAKRFGATEGEGRSILKHLIEGGDLSRYGLFNAITRTAEDLPDYDRATEFERLGGQVIELKRHDWEELAKAA